MGKKPSELTMKAMRQAREAFDAAQDLSYQVVLAEAKRRGVPEAMRFAAMVVSELRRLQWAASFLAESAALEGGN